MSNHFFTYIKLLAAVTAWGGTFIAAKYAVIDNSVEMAALLRFIASSLILLAILYKKNGSLPRLSQFQFIQIVLLGLTGVATYNLFFFYGLKTVDAGRGALIITSNPIWVALGSVIFFRQRYHFINIFGLLLCVIGVTIVLSKGHISDLFSTGIGLGEIALIGCGMSWASYTLLGKYLMESKQPLSPLALVTYSSVSGSILLALWIIIQGQSLAINPTIELYSAIAYLSIVGTVAGFIWFFDAVKIVGATQSSVFVFFVPVSAIILGYLLLDEKITLSLSIGAILIISGIALVNKRKTI